MLLAKIKARANLALTLTILIASLVVGMEIISEFRAVLPAP